uniref:Uncharacterized protein n=1 Tax=Physcomitrium patens TaxID=3218 RepID=A0A2K1KHF5_PHYPA|nr:hypothetical protein PHYPA_009588 [Physcomitrium patens]
MNPAFTSPQPNRPHQQQPPSSIHANAPETYAAK